MSTDWNISTPSSSATEKADLEKQDYEQDIQLRRTLFTRVWWLCIGSSVFIGILALIKGFCSCFSLSDTVFVALITGVVTESLGILALVARYLFPQDKR